MDEHATTRPGTPAPPRDRAWRRVEILHEKVREVVDAEVHLVPLRGAPQRDGHDPRVQDERVQRDAGVQERLAVVGNLAQVGHLEPGALEDEEGRVAGLSRGWPRARPRPWPRCGTRGRRSRPAQRAARRGKTHAGVGAGDEDRAARRHRGRGGGVHPGLLGDRGERPRADGRGDAPENRAPRGFGRGGDTVYVEPRRFRAVARGDASDATRRARRSRPRRSGVDVIHSRAAIGDADGAPRSGGRDRRGGHRRREHDDERVEKATPKGRRRTDRALDECAGRATKSPVNTTRRHVTRLS